jgi:hypothetical protein
LGLRSEGPNLKIFTITCNAFLVLNVLLPHRF